MISPRAASILVVCAGLAMAGPTGGADVGPAAPDLLFFSNRVAGDLHGRCATCHSDPESAGRYLLEPLRDPAAPDAKRILKNYRATLRFLDAASPGESPLLRKALGEGHSGGAIYSSSASKDYEVLLQFAMGATMDNRPPEAIVQKRYDATVGRDLRIDGTLSGDPDGDEIAYRWRLAEQPAGSRAALRHEPGTALLTADRDGLYRIELVVDDGKLASLPASLLVVARGAKAAPTRRPEVTTDKAATPAEKPMLDRRLDEKRLRLIRRLYYDLKWRSPKLDEIKEWYPRTHEEMVRAFLADEETWDAWYEQQLYYFLLLDRFRPKEGRLTTISARLTKSEITLPRALEEIVRSQYFNARNPGNDTFVTVVLEQCLGMVVQERANKRYLDAGKKMYDGYKTKLFRQKGDSQADFVRIVFSQPEFYSHFLGRIYEDLHEKELPAKKLKPYVDRCLEDPAAAREILVEWLTGADYVDAVDTARSKREIPYVRALFLDALDRLPSYEELRNVRNAFLSLADPTPIRLVMGRVLLESDQARMPPSAIDPEVFVKEQFLRLFARMPSPKELDTFVSSLKDDARVTPRVVLWTLMSSPEYQTY